MAIVIHSQTSIHPTRPMLRPERPHRPVLDEWDGCACCHSCVEVVREARFGYVPFCHSCLDRTLHPSVWDDLGEGD